jgi:hypothetical protein
LRLLVVYVAIRLAGWTTGWMESTPAAVAILQGLDYAALGIPLGLVTLELFHWSPIRTGKLIYLMSVSGLYGGLLLAVHVGNRWLVLALTAGAAVFHATEYLAIVTHYAWRRQSVGGAGAFQTLARNWPVVFSTYLISWGLCAYMADRWHPKLAARRRLPEIAGAGGRYDIFNQRSDVTVLPPGRS